MASGLATARSSSKIAVDICKVAFFMVSLYLLIFFVPNNWQLSAGV